ncbi:MAG: hypothetical protein M0Z95_05520 [Actinomycetota bacterium]|jgi:hypothetical protein|nr:hypothetical protein [Actinomycetota bacterium]
MTDRFFRRAVAIVACIGIAATSLSACGDRTATSTATGAAVQWPTPLATSIATLWEPARQYR